VPATLISCHWPSKIRSLKLYLDLRACMSKLSPLKAFPFGVLDPRRLWVPPPREYQIHATRTCRAHPDEAFLIPDLQTSPTKDIPRCSRGSAHRIKFSHSNSAQPTKRCCFCYGPNYSKTSRAISGGRDDSNEAGLYVEYMSLVVHMLIFLLIPIHSLIVTQHVWCYKKAPPTYTSSEPGAGSPQ
jgi:hypothetical protein